MMDWERIVAALRDTAAKALERIEKRSVGYPYNNEKPWTEDAYSRDYITGRIDGIADTIEAMMAKQGRDVEYPHTITTTEGVFVWSDEHQWYVRADAKKETGE